MGTYIITKIFKLDPKYKVDHMIRQWVIYNKLEDFNSLLNYTDEDFKPYGGGNLSENKENDVNYTPADAGKPQVVYSTSHQ